MEWHSTYDRVLCAIVQHTERGTAGYWQHVTSLLNHALHELPPLMPNAVRDRYETEFDPYYHRRGAQFEAWEDALILAEPRTHTSVLALSRLARTLARPPLSVRERRTKLLRKQRRPRRLMKTEDCYSLQNS